MDVNYLYYRQQIETSLARAARSAAARKAHAELANEYEKKIDEAAAREPRARCTAKGEPDNGRGDDRSRG